jgi:hypothetical protein
MLIAVTERGSAWTVITVLLLWPPTVAVTVAVPGARAVTTPLLSTFNIVGSETDHDALEVTSPAERSL